MIRLDRVYQPIPFEEYNGKTAERMDSYERYNVIKNDYGSFSDKTLIDIASANGFFVFRFLQDGGKEATAVEANKQYVDFINEMAIGHGLNAKAYYYKDYPVKHFDIGIYLDTHYAEETESYPTYLRDNVDVIYTSCADGATESKKYKDLLNGYFLNVIPLYTGFQERVIYKCYTKKVS